MTFHKETATVDQLRHEAAKLRARSDYRAAHDLEHWANVVETQGLQCAAEAAERLARDSSKMSRAFVDIDESELRQRCAQLADVTVFGGSA
jgi:hypothetical protein